MCRVVQHEIDHPIEDIKVCVICEACITCYPHDITHPAPLKPKGCKPNMKNHVNKDLCPSCGCCNICYIGHHVGLCTLPEDIPQYYCVKGNSGSTAGYDCDKCSVGDTCEMSRKGQPEREIPEDALTFAALRNASLDRMPVYKNAKGEQTFKPDGSNWSYSDWYLAVQGELGELANYLKKLNRGDFTLDEIRPELAREIGDVICYVDILAFRLGIDTGEATRSKFNEVSDRVGCGVKI